MVSASDHGAMAPLTDERRVHPRRTLRHPVTLETPDGAAIACESVDVSIGGMRIRSSSRVPLGSCDIIVSAVGDDVLALQGEVVEEIIDASTGEITARIVFLPAPMTSLERVVALPDQGNEPSSRTRLRAWMVTAAVAAGLVITASLVVTFGDSPRGTATPTSAVAVTPLSEPAPMDAQPRVPAVASQTPEPAIVTVSPAATPTPGGADAPAPVTRPAAPPADPVPSSTARAERADNTVFVELGSSAEETSVTSTMGPSAEGDFVRVQLHVTPEPDGTTLPIAVTIENRGDETLRFEGGLRATVTASQDGVAAATTTLTSEAVTELAPGEVVTVEGVLDFGATGAYDVIAAVDVS